MTTKTNMLVTLSAGVFLAGSACAELTYTETAEPTGGWVISINGKNYAVGLNGKVKINGDASLRPTDTISTKITGSHTTAVK